MRVIQWVAVSVVLCCLGACTTPFGASNYQKAGAILYASGRFNLNQEYFPPEDFTITASEVAARYGHLCRAHYNCTILANYDAYYMLPDYGVVPSLSVPSHAVAVIDGRTGRLVKRP
jgi:hypothetical protein